ncbi:hypothetical protein T484DRAFT_3646918 [Baffinella frigidus]|nr:hypothetical protein T484DRAFT_3646918 [Cryptophyta sp. CCMP2293]
MSQNQQAQRAPAGFGSITQLQQPQPVTAAVVPPVNTGPPASATADVVQFVEEISKIAQTAAKAKKYEKRRKRDEDGGEIKTKILRTGLDRILDAIKNSYPDKFFADDPSAPPPVAVATEETDAMEPVEPLQQPLLRQRPIVVTPVENIQEALEGFDLRENITLEVPEFIYVYHEQQRFVFPGETLYSIEDLTLIKPENIMKLLRVLFRADKLQGSELTAGSTTDESENQDSADEANTACKLVGGETNQANINENSAKLAEKGRTGDVLKDICKALCPSTGKPCTRYLNPNTEDPGAWSRRSQRQVCGAVVVGCATCCSVNPRDAADYQMQRFIICSGCQIPPFNAVKRRLEVQELMRISMQKEKSRCMAQTPGSMQEFFKRSPDLLKPGVVPMLRKGDRVFILVLMLPVVSSLAEYKGSFETATVSKHDAWVMLYQVPQSGAFGKDPLERPLLEAYQFHNWKMSIDDKTKQITLRLGSGFSWVKSAYGCSMCYGVDKTAGFYAHPNEYIPKETRRYKQLFDEGAENYQTCVVKTENVARAPTNEEAGNIFWLLNMMNGRFLCLARGKHPCEEQASSNPFADDYKMSDQGSGSGGDEPGNSATGTGSSSSSASTSSASSEDDVATGESDGNSGNSSSESSDSSESDGESDDDGSD